VRETDILVEQQPPQGVLVCDHAGLVINKFLSREGAEWKYTWNASDELHVRAMKRADSMEKGAIFASLLVARS